MASICLVFQMAFKYQTICHPTSFWPFKYRIVRYSDPHCSTETCKNSLNRSQCKYRPLCNICTMLCVSLRTIAKVSQEWVNFSNLIFWPATTVSFRSKLCQIPFYFTNSTVFQTIVVLSRALLLVFRGLKCLISVTQSPKYTQLKRITYKSSS